MNGRSSQVRENRRRDVTVVRQQIALGDPLVRPEGLVEVRELEDTLALLDLRLDRRSLALHLIRLLVLAQALIHRRPQPAVVRPLGEAHLRHELGLDPDDVALAHLRHLGHLGEGRVVAPERLQAGEQPRDLGVVEAGADVPRPAQDAVLVDAEDKRAERVSASALPLRVPHDHELLPALGLELQPVARAPAGLVGRVGSLGHDPLEALLLRCRVQRRAVVEGGGDLDPALPGVHELREPLVPLGQRQVDQRRPLHLEQIEGDVEVRRAFLALLHRRERRPAILADGDDFAVEHAVGCPERALQRPDDRRKAIDEGLVVPAAQVDVAASDRRDRPEAVPLHLEEPALAGRHVGRERCQHRRVGAALPGRRTLLLLLLDDQPVLCVAAEMRRHERPEPVQPLAAQPDREAAVRLLLDELVRAVVPDLDGAGAVVPGRDLALERGVGERMILDVDRKVLLTRLQRHAFRHRPAGKRTVTLEPEVVVQVPRIVALDHEDRFLALAPLAKRLGRLPRATACARSPSARPCELSPC